MINSTNVPSVQQTNAWAKLSSGGALPLVDHGADVAAILRILLAKSHWRGLLEEAGGRPLTQTDIARLQAMAALHDLGKANHGFWARQFAGRPIVGHTNETVSLFQGKLADTPTVARLDRLIAGCGGDALFIPTMAHHGLPLAGYSAQAVASDRERARQDARHWQPSGNYDPLAELDRLLADVEERFPAVLEEHPPLPDSPAFVALFCGLVTLADWLGSDATAFPVVGPHGAARDGLRDVNAPLATSGRGLDRIASEAAHFASVFGFSPRGAQRHSDPLDLGPIALIEAETGSGKTEAALWRWLALRQAGLVDGLYFALPTRSAAVQLHSRVGRMLRAAFGEGVTATLAVPGYLRAGDDEGQALPGFEVTWPDSRANEARWAAEHPKRFLSARVAVGTIDQALISGLKVRHAHFRATMLARSLLVVDEVHSSDAYMGELLRLVLRNHVLLGGHALLLSATLGAESRERLLDPFGEPHTPSLTQALAVPFPALSGAKCPPQAVGDKDSRSKAVHWKLLPDIDAAETIAAKAVEAARAGASVLVVRNSVAGAVAVARAVEALAPELAFRAADVATLHHGRFAPDDRRLLDKAVEHAFGKGRTAAGRILCGTQTLEQSLDIDADLLITDLAPVDVLLQRIGRLHRHDRQDRGAYAGAQALILTPDHRDLSAYLGKVARRHGLGPMQDGGGVYPDLAVIEATWQLVEANAVINIPADNRRLVEKALHPERLEALVAAMPASWQTHAMMLGGRAYAERESARRYGLDLRIPFGELIFPTDESIATRLGGRDRLVIFDPPFPGPFGQPVSRLTLPHWMTQGIPPDAEPQVEPDGEMGGHIVMLGNRRFRYDRFGLDSLHS